MRKARFLLRGAGFFGFVQGRRISRSFRTHGTYSLPALAAKAAGHDSTAFATLHQSPHSGPIPSSPHCCAWLDVVQVSEPNHALSACFTGCGGQIRTADLEIMSLPRYRSSTPRQIGIIARRLWQRNYSYACPAARGSVAIAGVGPDFALVGYGRSRPGRGEGDGWREDDG